MHLTKNASKNAGFTLVELIVVITILAILATIAFISYQGYTTDARNAKRSQDINSIVSKIGERRAANSIPLSSLTSDSVNKLTTVSIAGANPAAGEYDAGSINYAFLALKQADFQDPDANTAYRLGWTTKKLGQFEIAAKLGGDVPKSIVKGTYTNRSIAIFTPTAADSVTKTITVSASTGALLFVGDSLTIASTTGIITAISPDLTRITLNTALTAAATTAITEVGGLVGKNGNLATAVTNDSTTDFPY